VGDRVHGELLQTADSRRKTHEANQRAMRHLEAAFGPWRLVDVTADEIEQYLRDRLKKRACVKARTGYRELGS
jgi:hypothetical protein